MAHKLDYIRNSWAAFNNGALMKSSTCGAGWEVGGGVSGGVCVWGRGVFLQLLPLMCVVSHKGWGRCWLGGWSWGSRHLNGLERVVGGVQSRGARAKPPPRPAACVFAARSPQPPPTPPERRPHLSGVEPESAGTRFQAPVAPQGPFLEPAGVLSF